MNLTKYENKMKQIKKTIFMLRCVVQKFAI